MKKYIYILPITLIIISILISCKKNDTSDVLKDCGASIKDKTWWGQLTYNGQTAEYYAVHFNADSTLIWSQLSGNYPGVWAINGKQLKMTFPALGSEIKGDISDNDTLMNITDNNASVTINSGKLIADPYVFLDNTVWKGAYRDVEGISQPMQITFKPNYKVEIKYTEGPIHQYLYTRTESGRGGVVRVDVNNGLFFIFGVITSGNEMKGSKVDSDTPWQATKQ